MSDLPNSTRLRQYYESVRKIPAIGGAGVLLKLGELTSACIEDKSHAQDAVAFALSMIFSLHAEDRDEQPVTTGDTYVLMASGGAEHIPAAIEFIENGGPADRAVEIIAGLARLTPNHIRSGA